MAGVTEANYKSNDEGKEVATKQVPPIGGADYRASIGLPTTVSVVDSAHLTDGNRAEGVHYDSSVSIGEKVTTDAYPAGTVMNDSTPSDPVN